MFIFSDYNHRNLEYLSLRNKLSYWIFVCFVKTFRAVKLDARREWAQGMLYILEKFFLHMT